MDTNTIGSGLLIPAKGICRSVSVRIKGQPDKTRLWITGRVVAACADTADVAHVIISAVAIIPVPMSGGKRIL